MAANQARRQFMLFHAVLALGLLIMSGETLAHALHDFTGGHVHLAFVAGAETLAAALFLIPRTVRWGGVVLLVILLAGFGYHVTLGEWELPLLIYAAGVWFVMAHGPAWGEHAAPNRAAA